MKRHRKKLIRTLVLSSLVAGTTLLSSALADDGWELGRTINGQPDLQGVWANNSITPVERPEMFADREYLSDEEMQFLERRMSELTAGGGDALFGESVLDAAFSGNETSRDAQTGNYDQQWMVERTLDNRTSQIIDPPDGRFPARTPKAIALGRELAAYRQEHPADSWLDFDAGDRCLLGLNAGPPIIPAAYNQNLQVFQTPDYVVLLTEMVHTVRVVPLDARPLVSNAIRQWSGDARGHWEGDTLVIETSNFVGNRSWTSSNPMGALGSSEKLQLVERLTRIDADTLEYKFTVTDPEIWAQSCTAEIPMRRSNAPLYEYACHEGNHSLPNMLAGQRAIERRQSDRP